ncbi:EscE/YscE/SsaE family type III secretion system needle protein co-chaperone [Trinickia sp. EG282A]|uniref:EscE/YscE/SsaE family type III secretion system needle protein co-chaperone n=1 Tax=Trinickia sp. EG282A TaxID=3237013 RepID=UPI0034D25837
MTRITCLEDMLYEDGEGSARVVLLDELRRAEEELRRQLRTPEKPEKHDAMLRCAQAMASAQAVIETLWHRYHVDAA